MCEIFGVSAYLGFAQSTDRLLLRDLQLAEVGQRVAAGFGAHMVVVLSRPDEMLPSFCRRCKDCLALYTYIEDGQSASNVPDAVGPGGMFEHAVKVAR